VPINDALYALDATTLARRLARRELSAEALVQDCLARIAEREPQVRAFAHLDAESALALARALDAGPIRGPLHGLPLGMKDVFDTADMPTSYGSPIHAGHRPACDAAIVALSREAGAVLVGKTVTTEFATYHPGPTCHPYAPERTPGGSSSGSAAAVADGMLPLATGTQTAGSIIRPAAFCGVVGFKPSHGRISRSGLKMLSETLDTVGGFGRTVPDVALLASVLAGDAGLTVSSAAPNASGVRIGVFAGPDAQRMDADMQALWERVCARLSRLGTQPGDLAVPAWFEPLAGLQTDVMQAEMARSLSHERLRHADLFSPRLAGMIDAGLSLDAAEHVRHLQQVHDARHAARELFAHHDLLIAPSTIGEAVPKVEGTGDPLFCRAWTVLGLPCLHMPLGVGRHGLPIGLQLIGPALADQAVLQAGAWLHDRLRD